jgi:hypothetical protein
MKKISKKIKKTKKTIITFILGFFIFIIFLISQLKYFPNTKAQVTEFNFKIKIQGDFTNRKNVTYKTLIAFYTPYEKKYEFKDQEFNLIEGNIFSTKIYITNFEKNNLYSFFIKPEKYLGRVFSNYVIDKDNVDIDLTKDYFYGGDISPYDGEVSAYDLSKIFKNLGKAVSETDVNQDGITGVQDYLTALYTLKNNIKEDKITLLPQPTPTQTPTPTNQTTNTPTQNNTPTPNPTLISTPNLTNTPTPSNQTNNLCSTMDNGLPHSKVYYPQGTTSLPKTNERICAENGLYYSLPYRNPNCEVKEKDIQKAYEKLKSYYPAYFSQTKLLEQWSIVQKYAKKYNFNPLFVIALWLEESAAGGAKNAQQLGCVYRLNKDGSFTHLSPSSTICDQMECLFGRRSVVPDNFGFWACQYQHGADAWQNNTCTKTVTFTKVLSFWYEFIGGDNLPESCKIKYYSSCK